MKNFHDFQVKDINGDTIQFSKYKGKKLMVVNVASECGLTPQYEVLQEIYQEFGGDKFEIIGFPANNFGGQEPGSNEEIKTFCTTKFSVSFPMMSKISVKGSDQHEVYRWLTQKEENGVEDAPVEWNFQKFLIDESGNWVKSIHPQTNPAEEEVLNWIQS